MYFLNNKNKKEVQTIGIGFVILILIGLNFYMLNKVIRSSNNQKSLEKNVTYEN